MSEKWKEKLRCALQAIADLEAYVHGVTYEDFAGDKMRQHAVERNLEIIGEAAHHIPDPVKDAYPDTDWTDIYGMRNILAHGYDIVDSTTVWDTANYDLKDLKSVLQSIQEKY